MGLWEWRKTLQDVYEKVKQIPGLMERLGGLQEAVEGAVRIMDESKQNLESVAKLINKWEIHVEGSEIMVKGGFRPSDPDTDLAANVLQLKERCKAAGFPVVGMDSEGEIGKDSF